MAATTPGRRSEPVTVLFLGAPESPVYAYLREREERVIQTMDRPGAGAIEWETAEFMVSYGYRYILRRDVLDRFPDRAVNLHISYLPWNRGADPNFWSWVDETPKGVTIHYLDEGVDTGDIIAQKWVEFTEQETLRTSYDRLQIEMCELFFEWWPAIREGRCPRLKQSGESTYHRSRDKDPYMTLLPQGWDTPVSALPELLSRVDRGHQ